MDVKEAAALLSCKPESVADAITQGVKLPTSGKTVKLRAAAKGGSFVISDDELDEFIKAFESEQPGRHPPVAVRRELRTEACHKCGICSSDLPLQYHHILEWSDINHHDPAHMLAVCGGCHDKIRTGQIDRKDQRVYKTRLRDRLELRQTQSSAGNVFPQGASSPLSWDTLRDVVEVLHESVASAEATSDSKFDFSLTEQELKNRLNRLGEDTFAVMRECDEPFFGRIQTFLENPRNTAAATMYHEIVDELRRRIAAVQSKCESFEQVLDEIYHTVLQRFGDRLSGKRRTLRILVSFMYFNCDIGRKA